MGHMLRRITAVIGAASLALAGVVGATATHQIVTNAHPSRAASADWPMFGGNTDNNRYSPLNQINPSNVSKLGIAWTAQEGKNVTEFETTPVVV
ncbi:MAG TPA: hypothetical protein VNL71_21565, partial [Chloroflexota bacterium]|nr:hypothetical protein [Chloroflexota bacterium]